MHFISTIKYKHIYFEMNYSRLNRCYIIYQIRYTCSRNSFTMLTSTAVDFKRVMLYHILFK